MFSVKNGRNSELSARDNGQSPRFPRCTTKMDSIAELLRGTKTESSGRTSALRNNYTLASSIYNRNGLNRYSPSLYEDPDLTLVNNLDWLINFSVRSLFHCALDEDQSADSLRNLTESHQKPLSTASNSGCANGSLLYENGSPALKSSGAFSPFHVEQKKISHHEKPLMTYPQLIEKCLKEQGALTVHQIYKWITTRYPFYEENDDGWKNAVRHNLSMQSRFKKGRKVQGKGHIWYLDNSIGKQHKIAKNPHVLGIEPSSFSVSLNDGQCFEIPPLELIPEKQAQRVSENTTSPEATFYDIDNQQLVIREPCYLTVESEVTVHTEPINESKTLSQASWEFSNMTVCNNGANSQTWISNDIPSLTHEAFETCSEPMVNYLQPLIPKLEYSDLIEGFETKEVSNDDILKVLDSMDIDSVDFT